MSDLVSPGLRRRLTITSGALGGPSNKTNSTSGLYANLFATSPLRTSSANDVGQSDQNQPTATSSNAGSIFKRRRTLGETQLPQVVCDFRPTLEVVPATPGATEERSCETDRGPRFILPEIKDPVCPNSPRVNESIQRAMEGKSSYLQVPFNVPKRRHSWICG